LLILHGGAAGVRDEGLLLSAPRTPATPGRSAEAADVIDLAAAYTFGIVRNHPFVDGNKRTGFVVGLLFLERRRRRAAPEEDAAQAAFSLADGSLDEAGYTAFLRANTKLP
jgi:death-on-curing protein